MPHSSYPQPSPLRAIPIPKFLFEGTSFLGSDKQLWPALTLLISLWLVAASPRWSLHSFGGRTPGRSPMEQTLTWFQIIFVGILNLPIVVKAFIDYFRLWETIPHRFMPLYYHDNSACWVTDAYFHFTDSKIRTLISASWLISQWKKGMNYSNVILEKLVFLVETSTSSFHIIKWMADVLKLYYLPLLKKKKREKM